jgi:hypothetical protein
MSGSCKKWFFVRTRNTLILKLILVWMEKIMGGEKGRALQDYELCILEKLSPF